MTMIIKNMEIIIQNGMKSIAIDQIKSIEIMDFCDMGDDDNEMIVFAKITTI